MWSSSHTQPRWKSGSWIFPDRISSNMECNDAFVLSNVLTVFLSGTIARVAFGAKSNGELRLSVQRLLANLVDDLIVKGPFPSEWRSFSKLGPDEELIEVSNSDWYQTIREQTTPGENMRIYRELHGLSQQQLGSKLGRLTRQNISNMEHGRAGSA